MDALALFGGDEDAEVAEGVPVRVPPAGHVPRTSAEALAALAPPPPKPKPAPCLLLQNPNPYLDARRLFRPAGTPDIRQFFSAPKKRDRDDDDRGFVDDRGFADRLFFFFLFFLRVDQVFGC